MDGLSQHPERPVQKEEVVYWTEYLPNPNIIFSGPFSFQIQQSFEGELYFTKPLPGPEVLHDLLPVIDSPPMGSVI